MSTVVPPAFAIWMNQALIKLYRREFKVNKNILYTLDRLLEKEIFNIVFRLIIYINFIVDCLWSTNASPKSIITICQSFLSLPKSKHHSSHKIFCSIKREASEKTKYKFCHQEPKILYRLFHCILIPKLKTY